MRDDAVLRRALPLGRGLGRRQQLNSTETIVYIIRRKKLTLFEHVCRMANNRLVKNVLLGYMKGIRRRGRQPKRRISQSGWI